MARRNRLGRPKGQVHRLSLHSGFFAALQAGQILVKLRDHGSVNLH